MSIKRTHDSQNEHQQSAGVTSNADVGADIEFPEKPVHSRYHRPASVVPVAGPLGLTQAERKAVSDMVGD